MEEKANEYTISVLKENVRNEIIELEKLFPLFEDLHIRLSKLDSDDSKDSLYSCTKGIEDLLFGCNFILYELLSYMNMSIDSVINYEKRYCLQCINECICEAYNFLWGKKNNGMIKRLKSTTINLNITILNTVIDEIETEIMKLGENYLNNNLRNITAHYDKPLTMYDKISEIKDENFFCKGISQFMLIHTHICDLADMFFAILVRILPKNHVRKSCYEKTKPQWNFKDFFANKFAERISFEGHLEIISKESLISVSKSIDTLFDNHKCMNEMIQHFKFNDVGLVLIDQLCMVMMMIAFVRCDITCAMRAYMHSETNLERAMHLRKIYLIEANSLKHLYGYNNESRQASIWTKLISINYDYNKDKTKLIQTKLDSFESHLDTTKRNLFSHFMEKDQNNIVLRYKAYMQMDHIDEINEALELLSLCKEIENYAADILRHINESAQNNLKEQISKTCEIFYRLRDQVSHAGNAHTIAMLDNIDKFLERISN